MKSFVHKLNVHPRYSRFLYWGKLITITSGAQAIVQATGLACGIMIIRLLPTQEYALYTIANTMLGTMGVLADGGISAGVMAQAGKVWQDKEKLGVVLATGLELRKKFAVGSLVVTIPLLLYLLVHHGATGTKALLIVLALIPAFYAALSDSLLEIVPRLHQNVSSLQKNQLSVSLGRLFLSGLSLLMFPFTFIALLSNSVPRLFGNLKLKYLAGIHADYRQKPSNEVSNEIIKIVRRVLPGSLYFCISGQLTIWLLSVCGNTTSIAQVGALGRLSMLLSLFSVIVSTLFVPRFARLENDRSVLLSRLLQITLTVILVCILIIAGIWLFPQTFLMILGEQYIGLNYELLLNMTGGCITIIWGIIFSLYTSRGWVIHPGLSISLSIGAILAGIYLFDISSLTGILYFNIFVGLVEFTYHSLFALLKILSTK